MAKLALIRSANLIRGSLLAKQIVGFLLVALIPTAVVGYLSFTSALATIERIEFEKLDEAREAKNKDVLVYFRETVANMRFLGELPAVQKAFRDLQSYRDYVLFLKRDRSAQDAALDLSLDVYKNIESEIAAVSQSWLTLYGERNSYEDLLVIVGDVSGDVMYAEKKGSDLGTSLKNGPLKDSALAKVWQKVISTRKPALVDFGNYRPTGKPGAFVGVPIYSEPGKVGGVLAVRLGESCLNEIMKVTQAMGETGQAYLVGPDLLMRSNSRFENGRTILNKKVDTIASRAALENKHGLVVVAEDGRQPALTSYSPAGIRTAADLNADFEWGVIAEIGAKEANRPALALRNQILLVAAAIGMIAALAAVLMGRTMSKPMAALEQQVKLVTRGDLSLEISFQDRADEIGLLAQGIGQFVKYVRNQVRQVLDVANVVAKFASEITSAAAQIAQSTSRTSAAVSQGAATAEEVRQSARLVGEKTERVAESSKHAAEALQVGTEATDETLGKMELIREQMESIGDTVVRLSEHSQAVEEIIETVKDLSEQSNLLAVNASIEAARAGDQGRGFSVVAQEIKSLAEQSREATVQVRSILEDTRKWINAVVLGTEHGNRAVQAGVRQAGLAGDTIKTLANAMSNWTQAAGMVHASSEQQAAGAEQVSIAMTSIDEAMRQNLHGISQLEKTARELEKLADTLARTLERYKV